MSENTPTTGNPITAVNPYEHLQIVYNPDDDTLTQLAPMPTTTHLNTDPSASPVLIKDIPLNSTTSTWLRIFRPSHVAISFPSSPPKLPIIVYFHGGGFIMLSAATTVFHNFCANMAHQLPALVVSVDYRLAPKHRLPTAYEDAVDAIHWIRDRTEDEWLREFGDVSQCYLMGGSAGGNIAYHAALRTAAAHQSIRGVILQQPFFGGSRRTGSEMRLVNDWMLPLCSNDLMWELGLPVGADRDHEYCNPMLMMEEDDENHKILERIGLLGWRWLVIGCEGDPLVDRQKEVARMLEDKGVEVVGVFTEGGFHGVDFFGPKEEAKRLMVIKDFIYPSM